MVNNGDDNGIYPTWLWHSQFAMVLSHGPFIEVDDGPIHTNIKTSFFLFWGIFHGYLKS